MALPSVGELTLIDIAIEFGHPDKNNSLLTDFYAGGDYVPTGASGDNGPIPENGEISIDDFYGASSFNYTVTQAIFGAQNRYGYGPT